MSQRTNQWKLGAFVLAGITVAIVAFFWVGAQRLKQETAPVVTFFDESVQGLDVGAPVKMRGVTIGEVERISIARDRRLVRVDIDLYLERLERNGLLGPTEVDGDSVPGDVRVQLASQGITGGKYLLIDFFEDAPEQLEAVDLDESDLYLPSTPSTLKGLEDSLNTLAARMPGMLDSFERMLSTVERKLEETDLNEIVASADALIVEARAQLAGLDTPGLREQFDATLAELRRTGSVAREGVQRVLATGGPLDRMIAEVESIAVEAKGFTDLAGETLREAQLGPTTARLRDAVDSVESVTGEVGVTLGAYRALAGDASRLTADARELAPQLAETLVALRTTLRSVERLTSMLERQPAALLRGRPAENSDPPGRGSR